MSFKFKRLGKIDFIVETNLGCESRIQMVSFDGKTKGQEYHACVPLIISNQGKRNRGNLKKARMLTSEKYYRILEGKAAFNSEKPTKGLINHAD